MTMTGRTASYNTASDDTQSAARSIPSVPHSPFLRNAPVGEAKEGVRDELMDAEQWLTRKPTLSHESPKKIHEKEGEGYNKENEAKRVTPSKAGKDEHERGETDAEQWLTRGNRELLLHWKRQQEEGDRYAAIEARSSVSSPGNSSLREKLRHRIQKRQEMVERQRQLEYEQPKSRFFQDDSMESILAGHWTDPDKAPASPTSNSGLSLPVDPHSKRNISTSPDDEAATNISLYRLSRTVRYGRRGEVPRYTNPKGHSNVIRLHVYDLIATDTIMQLPFGCDFPIGKCFQTMNDGLHALGTGAYHCGIEVNGIEYAYGANDIAGSTGVFTCVPKRSPGYEYRASIDFGPRTVRRTSWAHVQTDLINTKTGEGKKVSEVYEAVDNYLDGRDILKQMATEYRGMDYDLLEKNCCTFAREACVRLGIEEEEIPTWFMSLASTGAEARDTAYRTLSVFRPEPEQMLQQREQIQEVEDGGFEVIAEETARSTAIIEVLRVVDTLDGRDLSPATPYGVRRTLSWTY